MILFVAPRDVFNIIATQLKILNPETYTLKLL